MKTIYPIVIIVLSALIIGCERHPFPDLTDYLAKIDKEAAANPSHKKVESAVPTSTPAIYQNTAGLRSPFEESGANLGAVGNATNPLTQYPINALHYVGLVKQNGHVSAYIMAPDNKLYRVIVGDTIGDHSGRITQINDDKLEIVEQPSANEKPDAQQIVTLPLKEDPNHD